jgi:hypothetical protein
MTRIWVCSLWIAFTSFLSSVRILHIAWYWKFFLVHYIQVLRQYRLCNTERAYITYFMLQWHLSYLNGPKLNSTRVSVTLRLTVSQSVCLGIVPNLGHMTRNLLVYFNFEKVLVLPMWAPSLTRGRVCRLSVSPMSLSVYIYIYTVYLQNITEIFFNIQYLQGFCQSGLSTADYALLLVAFATTAVLDTWTVVCLTNSTNLLVLVTQPRNGHTEKRLFHHFAFSRCQGNKVSTYCSLFTQLLLGYGSTCHNTNNIRKCGWSDWVYWSATSGSMSFVCIVGKTIMLHNF